MELGFDVLGIKLFDDGSDGQPVSSTRIRRLLAEGDVVSAAELHSVASTVRGTSSVTGTPAGVSSAYPTANVIVSGDDPAPGRRDLCRVVPATRRRPPRRRPVPARAPADLLRLGRGTPSSRPTSSTSRATSTTNRLWVEFEAHLRRELRFDGPNAVSALVEQMGRDVAAARLRLRA